MNDAAALEAAGRTEDALAALGTADPASTPPGLALVAGRCLLRRPAPVEAMPWLTRAAAPDAAPHVRLEALRLAGQAWMALGRESAAAACFEALLALRPAAPHARFLLARCWHALGWHDRALSHMATLPPPLPAWWGALREEMRRAMGEARAEALRQFRGRRLGRRLRPGAALILALLRCGRMAAAEGLLARGLQRAPRDPLLAVARAAIALRRGAAPGPLPPLLEDAPPVLRRVAASLALQAGDPAASLVALGGDHPAPPGSEEEALRARALLLGREPARLRTEAAAAMAAAPLAPQPARLVLTAAAQGGEVAVWRGGSMPAAPARMTLVQFWHAPDPPADVVAVLGSWLAHNPGFVLRRFDAATARAEIAAHASPALLAVFDAAHHPAMQADILRLFALHRFGGIYADADERCLRPVPDLAAGLAGSGLAARYSDAAPYVLFNDILRADAGSTVLAEALDAISVEVPPMIRAGRRVAIWNATGPGLLTRIVARRLARGEGQGIALICPQTKIALAETVDRLAYKHASGGDWRRV